MEKKSDSKNDKIPYNISYENYLDTNACTECTGLMPGPASGREEWDMYQEIFDFTAKPSHSSQDDGKHSDS